MSDTNERLERIEHTLGTMNEQLGEIRGRQDREDERFVKIDEHFVKIDERFNQVDERFNQIDERFDQVDEHFKKVDTRLDSLETNVQSLRVLGEENTRQIKLVAEVQVHHGEVLERHGKMLEQIVNDMGPLKQQAEAIARLAKDIEPIKDFVTRVAGDHERRITELEKRTWPA